MTDKVVKLVGGGCVINKAFPSSFNGNYRKIVEFKFSKWVATLILKFNKRVVLEATLLLNFSKIVTTRFLNLHCTILWSDTFFAVVNTTKL